MLYKKLYHKNGEYEKKKFPGEPCKRNRQGLDALLNSELETEETIEPAIFRSSTIVNSHSVTFPYPGTLDFRIEHRFGQLNTGVYELWGLDNAEIHFSFEYGISDWLLVGAGRGTYEKTYDALPSSPHAHPDSA